MRKESGGIILPGSFYFPIYCVKDLSFLKELVILGAIGPVSDNLEQLLKG